MPTFALPKKSAVAAGEECKVAAEVEANHARVNTVTRVLDTQFRGGHFQPGGGVTDTYIHPPYEFCAVDVLQE